MPQRLSITGVSLEGRYDWDLIGYLQSEKYFRHCENTIREYFTLKDRHVAYLRSKYGHLLEANCCSISVRRGDYLLVQHNYPVLSMNYYNRAMALMPSDTVYLVFSDAIGWCKRQFVDDRFFLIEEPSEVLSLHLISFCRNNIIANSTFGWWGGHGFFASALEGSHDHESRIHSNLRTEYLGVWVWRRVSAQAHKGLQEIP